MSIRKAVPLFNDEFVVSPSGIYTFAHHYIHPHTGRKVIIVGMNHAGDEEYFEKIKQILAECDLVLFEDIRKERKSSHDREAEEAEMRKVFFGSNVEKAFFCAMQLYFMNAQKVLSSPEEEEAFDAEYNQPHWFSGDTMLLTETQKREYLELLTNKLQAIPQERKQEMVEYVKTALRKMERGQFTKRDLGEGFIFFWQDKQLVETVLEVLGKPRDLHCFQEFDRLVQERNPQLVGIKFGAGHIPHLRSLLEARNYFRWCTSTKLRNLSFKKS